MEITNTNDKEPCDRTRNAIAIWAEETSFQQGILKTTARNMGLKERLDRKTSVE